jgi:hypothetical protein
VSVECEQRSARLDIDEDIDVALLVIVTARNRPEHSHVTHAVPCRGIQDFAAVLTERFQPHVPMIAVRISIVTLLDGAADVLFVEAAE